MLARIRAALRRSVQPVGEPIFQIDELLLDYSRRVTMIKGIEISLTPTEYDLLRFLALNAGRVVTHSQLLRQVWGIGYERDLHILRVNVSNLRRKIEPDPNRPHYILTEPGVGYRLRTA